MKPHTRELNDLIGSRICHDLISPLGAIGNGVELLTMSGMPQAPEMMLISESVDNASARIRFFRIAFGFASVDAMVANSESSRVLRDLYRGNRLRVAWRIEGDKNRLETKLAFLILLCFESALPWGGKVAVTQHGDTWNIYGTAERVKVEETLWALFSEDSAETEVTPSNVHFALVGPTAKACGKKVHAAINGTSISVSF